MAFFEPREVKGEILKLRNKLDSNDPDDRKAAAKRVVALMRQGENVGSLFSSMLRCVKTDDIQIKKLVYLYLVTYSSQEPEQSIMVVNTFIADANDFNPIVRALAVRTMCRIKLDTVAEHMIIPLKRALKDQDPYVRKTAAIAVAKLYDVIPEAVENAQLLGDLVECLNDENPMVVSNTTVALLEVNERRATPIFKFNERNVSPVLSAMTQCSGWVQTLLLDGLAKYTPESDSDAQFLIDRLVPFLKHANSAVVIGAFKCIYNCMQVSKRPHGEVLQAIIPPLITLVTSAEPEVQFVVLRTLSLFVMSNPGVLGKEIRVFFCKYNDPSYVKMEKLNIIVTIVSPVNVQLVLNEMEEYCNSVDVGFVRKTIQCIGQIALKCEFSARRCVGILVKMVESKAEYAVEEAIVVVTDLLRAFPGEFESVISKVCSNLEQIKETKAKAAAIWILGEYSHIIEKVDVLLDPYLDTFQDEAPEVQHQILIAMVKVYVRTPDDARDQLQFVLNEATKENVLPDVRNRAMIYWRFLSTTDLAVAKKAIIFEDKKVTPKANQFEQTVLEELIDNMGSVAGVLHIVPSDFVKKIKYLPEDDEDEDMVDEARNWMQVNVSDSMLYVFVDWSPMKFWLKVVNKAPTSVGSFAIAMNKNWAGINVSGTVDFPPSLEFGDAFEVGIPLEFNEKFYQPSETNVLQVALRTNSEAKMFTTPIDAFSVLKPINLTDAQLREAWGMYNGDVQIDVDGQLPSDQVFKDRNIQVMSKADKSVTVAFQLPPSFTFIAKMQQVNNKVMVMVHGNPQLFPMIRGSADSMFSS